MPNWLLYCLAGYGCLEFLTSLIVHIRRAAPARGRSLRMRVASLKETVYRLESTISEMREGMRTDNGIMLDIVRSMKDQAQTLKELATWAKQVRTVTDLWDKKFKESGPDGS